MSVATLNDVTRISDQVRDARTRREPLRVVGGGTWLDAGRPCPATARLAIAPLSGITRYEPGDFVLSARAGTTLNEIAEAARQHGQWLTLDPVGDAQGTIGATIATASYGPLASAFGTPRDHILGCEFVSGVGDVVRAGGQVVKNVAGFDLVRLVTGAWGTLGVLTEVTLRMRARPEVECTLAVSLEHEGPSALSRWLRETEFTPLAAELVNGALAAQLGLANASTALIRLGGNATLVRAARDATAALGATREVSPDIWSQWSAALAAQPVSFRGSALPSRIDTAWRWGHAVTENHGGLVSATVERGVLRCALHGAVSSERMAAASSENITVIGERLPDEQWRALPRASSVRALEQRVQRAFDPDGILNPGILDA